MWCLIVSIPDLCTLTYFNLLLLRSKATLILYNLHPFLAPVLGKQVNLGMKTRTCVDNASQTKLLIVQNINKSKSYMNITRNLFRNDKCFAFWVILYASRLQKRVCNGKLFSLFLINDICCEYSKEPSQ